MASEMSEFTKYQILVQSGTAMVAQANQVAQVVLSLF
jgi:flagellin